MEKGKSISFLVGAGLSMDANLPGSVGLAQRLEKAFQADQPVSSTASNDILLKLFRFLDGGIRFQRGIVGSNPSHPINIEELAVAALRLRLRANNPIAPYVSGWHNRLVELEATHPELLLVFEDILYERLAFFLSVSQATGYAYLSRFTDFVDAGFEVNIFTINYDLLVEAALTSRNVQFINGMGGTGEWQSAAFFQTDGPSTPRLFKLHGSLDWVDHEQYGICSLEYPRHREAELFERAQRPLIIFGTDQKLTAREPYLSLFYAFSTTLLRSDIVIVIGYSFGDQHLNEILVQRFKDNRRQRMLVVGPNADSELAAMPKLYRHPRVVSLPCSAKQALGDCLALQHLQRILAEIQEEPPF